ncbi:MAG TPA: tetratricopeptide repeat protein [Candidatus Sulfomarinibacteraceae bacterium]|nr:tetratricopeptide repeat protein [Candidatus Sulfomarinibacteraceae bacterium]
MIIQRKPPRHPRSGPSCLLVLLVVAAFGLGAFVVGNAQEVRDVIVPTATPEPTRSAAEYATSAALYERDGEYENAVEAYERAIALDETNITYYLRLIDLLIAINRPQDALARADQAQVLAAERPDVWVARAAAHLANGYRLAETGGPDAELSFQEAINAAAGATELDPNAAEAYAYMAEALIRLGPERYNEAIENAALGVELAPDSPVTRKAMARAYEVRGLYDFAIEEYLAALDQNPNLHELRIDLAYLYFFTDRRQQGILALQDVISMDPNNAAAYDGLAYFYFVLGQYPRAEENAYQAVQLDPDMTRAHAHLGAAYFQQSKYDTAIEELDIAVSRYDEVTTSNATYFNMLGRAHYYQNSCDQAVPYFQQVLNAAPDTFAVSQAQDGMELCRQEQIRSE